MKIGCIISGGQTGADRSGLDAAISSGIKYSGTVPLGRRAEDGKVPDKYVGMVESDQWSYLPRTEANVVNSDATVVLCHGAPQRGSKKTLTFAAKHRKPYLAVNLNQPREKCLEKTVNWLKEIPVDVGTLNVAGSRESISPGIQKEVTELMVEVIRKVNEEETSLFD